jgi:hypothetical protein
MGIADQPVIEHGYELSVGTTPRSREQRPHLVGPRPGECAGEQRVEIVIWARGPDQPAHVVSLYLRLKYAPAARPAPMPTRSGNILESPYVLDHFLPTRQSDLSSRRENGVGNRKLGSSLCVAAAGLAQSLAASTPRALTPGAHLRSLAFLSRPGVKIRRPCVERTVKHPRPVTTAPGPVVYHQGDRLIRGSWKRPHFRPILRPGSSAIAERGSYADEPVAGDRNA